MDKTLLVVIEAPGKSTRGTVSYNATASKQACICDDENNECRIGQFCHIKGNRPWLKPRAGPWGADRRARGNSLKPRVCGFFLRVGESYDSRSIHAGSADNSGARRVCVSQGFGAVLTPLRGLAYHQGDP